MATSGVVFERLAVIGCGLMGGSFALALRQSGEVRSISGYSRRPDTTRRAMERGVVDQACDSAAQAVQGADLVLLAVPVGATHDTLTALLPSLSPHALVMDVGSTKRDVVAAARMALAHRVSQFVPSHPIAGKESGGIDHADPDLYAQRWAILTPLEANAPETIERAEAAWRSVGCRVATLSPEAHDQTFAAVSHLPHLLAFAYMQGLMEQGPQALQQHLSVAGPGFRDFSRIAASTSTIWRDIFSANRDEVLAQLNHFESALQAFRQALADGRDDDLAALVDAASAVRSRWSL